MNLKRIVMLILLLLPAASIQAQEKNAFGIVEGFWLPELTCELGVGWERIIFDWSQHQPTGPEDWHTLNVDDRWLKAANACNRDVVALFKNTPAWATDGTPGPGVPRGLDLPVDDPGNLWANFIRRSAAYYASRGVNHFIIWNEPDISREIYGFEYEGGLEDYFQLLKVGYLAAREGNPAAVIHMAGTTYWHDVNEGQRLYMDRLLERITQDSDAAEHDYYFDVFSLHIYFRTDTVYDIVHETRMLLDSYGLQDKRIWMNETNAAPTDDPQWPVVRPVYQLDLGQQAAFLMQAAGLGLAAGAERIAVYKLYDQELPPGGESFGILNPADQSPRPAFYTWQTVTRYLNGAVTVERASTEWVDVVRLLHADGHETLLAWARTGRDAALSVSIVGEKAQLINQYGEITLLHSSGEVYTLSLSGAQCNEVDGCAVGGPVSMLIQPATGAAIYDVTSGQPHELVFDEE